MGKLLEWLLGFGKRRRAIHGERADPDDEEDEDEEDDEWDTSLG